MEEFITHIPVLGKNLLSVPSNPEGTKKKNDRFNFMQMF